MDISQILYTEGMLEFLFVSWIALSPFVLLFGAYEGPKVFWMWIGGFFLTLWWIIRLVTMHPFTISKAGRWFFGWIVILGIASVIGIHPIDSIIGGSYRHQGVLLFLTLFLVSETIRQLHPRCKQWLLGSLASGVILESLIVLEQKLFSWSSRPFGTFGEPNEAAGFMAVGLLWLIIAPNINIWIRRIAFIITLAAIAATESRTGVAAAGLISIALLAKSIAHHRHRAVMLGTLLGITGAVAIAGYVFVRVIDITRPTSLIDDRSVFLKLGMDAVGKRPLFGYGAETEEWVYETEYKTINTSLVDFIVDRSHNVILDVTIWSGGIGLIFFMTWFLGEVWETVVARHDWARFAAVAGWFVFASFQPVGVIGWVQLLILFSTAGVSSQMHKTRLSKAHS